MNPVASISSLDLTVIVVYMVGILAAGLLAASSYNVHAHPARPRLCAVIFS